MKSLHFYLLKKLQKKLLKKKARGQQISDTEIQELITLTEKVQLK